MRCHGCTPLDSLALSLQIPHVARQEYTLLDITEDGFVCPSVPGPFAAISSCSGRTHQLVLLVLT